MTIRKKDLLEAIDELAAIKVGLLEITEKTDRVGIYITELQDKLIRKKLVKEE